jgi:hypothetical protein
VAPLWGATRYKSRHESRGDCLCDYKGRPRGINLTKSSSKSVVASVVERGREGLETVLANDSGNAKGEMGRRPQQGEDKPSPLLCLRSGLPGPSIVGAMACPRPVMGWSPCDGVVALWWGGRPVMGWSPSIHGCALPTISGYYGVSTPQFVVEPRYINAFHL